MVLVSGESDNMIRIPIFQIIDLIEFELPIL